jgi:alpha-mannosidase
MSRLAFCYVCLLTLCFHASAQEAKRIYLAPDDHTDYFWTADEAAYRNAFVAMLDYYITLAEKTAGEPPQWQSRWNCDGSYWLWTYERERGAEPFNRLLAQLRRGQMSAPLNALVSCYGGQPAEAALRGMYYSGRLERRYGLRFRQAVAMENQTLPLGLASLWAGSGARWSWHGVCACASKMPSATEPRDHEIYWLTGLDGQRVLMKWHSLNNRPRQGHANESIGGYAEARYPADAVEFLDKDEGFRRRYIDPSTGRTYAVSGAFGKGWDDLQTLTDEFPRIARALSNDRRQIIVSNMEDFFADFEARYGPTLPSESTARGNEWDLYPASMAELSAGVRRSVEKLRAAEALATLVSLQRPAFLDGRTAARDMAFMDLGLYWEHDWTADGPVKREVRAAWQRRLAKEIAGYVDTLHRDAAAALGTLIPTVGRWPRFYVFNPLGWERTAAVDLPYDGPWPAHVVDVTTRKEVPSQAVALNETRRLRILAPDVPAVGYKVFEARPGPGASLADAATVQGATVENEFYRVTLAGNGALTSMVDKKRNDRELVRGRANDLGGAGGTVAVEQSGPVSVTLRATGGGPPARTVRVTLVRGAKCIEVRNEINENFADVRSWAFYFNFVAPVVHHEEVGAVLLARLASDGGHYALRQARYDWLTLNHFVDMTGGGGVGITLSNADCAFFRPGQSKGTQLDTATPSLTVLAGGQVDGPELGITAQGGDKYFLQRFGLMTHAAYDQTAAMKFALEHQNPLVGARVAGGAGTAYPADSFSLLTVSHRDALLWALKPAEEGVGQGLIARIWNQASQTALFTLALNVPGRKLESAQSTTHLETDLAPADTGSGVLTARAAPQQMMTFRLRIK